VCLAEIQAPRRALIVGEGNGRFLLELLRAHPNAKIDCVDASGRMLSLGRQRLEGDDADRVQFLQRDLLAWTPAAARYDLIVTHFFLDCFLETELAEIVARLSQAATADAEWLLADFRIPAKGFARLRARVWLAVMYRFFRLTARIEANELVDPAPFLQAAGFVPMQERLFRGGILKSQLWRRQL
ncbi:MAG: class I SAM-dependent methyltransferase, partial [Chthoniobacterales bacterium]